MKKNKIVMCSILVAIVTFIIALFIYENYNIFKNSKIKVDDEKMLNATTNVISRKISLCKSATKALASTVEICINNKGDNNLQNEDFNLIAKTILDKYEGMNRVQFVRNGVISNIYPLDENTNLLNKAVEDKIPKSSLNAILNTKECFVDGPIDNALGGKSFIVRTSVFDKNQKYWGSACIIINIDDFVKQLKLKDLCKSGYDYEFYQVNGVTKEKFIIASSVKSDISNGLTVTMDYGPNKWYFVLKNKNESNINNYILIIVKLMALSAIFALLTYIMLKKREELLLETEKKARQLEEAKNYDKLKTEFFANLSHEFRTPINIMLSAIKMLEIYMIKDNCCMEENTKKIIEYRNIIKKNCYRLLRIIGNLIDVTKFDVQFLEMNLVQVNIVSLIEEITLSIAEYCKSKSVELIFDTDIEEKYTMCDQDKIDRVMLNLLSNAIKFTRDGDKIEVFIHDKEDYVEVSVKDTGIGIPKEAQNVIFDRFRQVNKGLSREHEGSGIGLSLVKSLIQMHGGQISLKSEVNIGSEFIFTLPIKKSSVAKENITKHISESNNLVETIKIEFSDLF